MYNDREMERTDQTIELVIKEHYGTERIYPLNYIPELQLLTGNKTLKREQIQALKNMGFVFSIRPNTL